MTARRPHPDVRLVAVDLDGTLLNDAKRVTPRTAAALRHVAGRGVRVVIASARPPRGARHVYHELGLDTWQINYNGALVWDESRRTAVSHLPMDPDVARGVAELARLHFPHVLVSCEVLDRWHTDRLDDTYTTETGRLFRPDVVAPLGRLFDEAVTKLMLLGDEHTVTALHRLLRDAAPHVASIRSDPDLIQVMHPSASKGAALRLVCGHYGVPPGQVLAVGDAVNDIPMLEAAGVAVAVENAHPEVKRVAHWVAPSNNHEGVAAAIGRFVPDPGGFG